MESYRSSTQLRKGLGALANITYQRTNYDKNGGFCDIIAMERLLTETESVNSHPRKTTTTKNKGDRPTTITNETLQGKKLTKAFLLDETQYLTLSNGSPSAVKVAAPLGDR